MENPQIRAEMIEASEFPDLSQQYGVYGVPKTIINESEEIEGAVPEAYLLRSLLAAVGAGSDGQGGGGAASDGDGGDVD